MKKAYAINGIIEKTKTKIDFPCRYEIKYTMVFLKIQWRWRRKLSPYYQDIVLDAFRKGFGAREKKIAEEIRIIEYLSGKQ